MASSMNIALPSGGPVAILYGLLASSVGTLAVAISLAEICSVYPSNGAQYEWTAILAPERHRRWMSYACGWIVTGSWWALAATGPSLFRNLTVGFIELFNPDYVFHNWHQFLLYLSVEVCALLINAFGTAAMPLLSKLAFFLSLTRFAAISVALLACTHNRHQTASFVFTGYINNTGWNNGLAWLLGLLQSCFSLTAFDAVAHLVEEMPRPRYDAPRTMIIAVIMGTVTGFIFCICVLFSISDVDEVVSSSFGPIITIFAQASGSNGGAVGMAIVIIMVVWFSAVEVVTASARLNRAFATHGGLPCSTYFSILNEGLDLPLNSMFLTNGMVVVFGLIYLGTPAAFNAIVSACVVGLNCSYAIPIGLLVFRGRQILPKGHMHLGRLGYAINLFAFIFLAFTNILFLFPSDANSTGSSMNYAIVAIAAVLLIAILFWLVHARKHYVTPKPVTFNANGVELNIDDTIDGVEVGVVPDTSAHSAEIAVGKSD
ncbi:amino acid/polyamine transporter I [Delphinella strobiligena]|nr:amino acid/polyamine transporter I [Delphinella strobiligena]